MRVYFVGIKGVGMANLAILLKKMGYAVLGSDVGKQFITDRVLEKNKIFVKEGFREENVENVDVLIYTAAHGGKRNVEVMTAMKRGIPIYHLSEYIGKFVLPKFRKKIGVAGTHGKTTTSSLISYALYKAGVQLGYLVGAPFFSGEFEGADYVGNEFFVLEADEYAVSPPDDLTPKFFHYRFDYVILPSLDFDHPDVYKSFLDVKKSFKHFLDLNRKATVIANLNDPNVAELVGEVKNKVFSYGFGDVDIKIQDLKFSKNASYFQIIFPEKNEFLYKISLLGEKNVLNAAGVISLLYLLGYDKETIGKLVTGFTGAKRRLEFKGYFMDKPIYDDYAHHPAEIEATLFAVRKAFRGKKILVVFQPHTFSRTKALLEEFVNSLLKADITLLLPIFPSARERNVSYKITSKDIVKMINNKGGKAVFVADFEQAASKIKEFAGEVDIILTIGAGDVYKCIEFLKKYEKNP